MRPKESTGVKLLLAMDRRPWQGAVYPSVVVVMVMVVVGWWL